MFSYEMGTSASPIGKLKILQFKVSKVISLGGQSVTTYVYNDFLSMKTLTLPQRILNQLFTSILIHH